MLFLKQTQWFLFRIRYFNKQLVQTSVHNLKQTFIYGKLLFYGSYNIVCLKSSSTKKSIKWTKFQAMAALNSKICNKKISKTESVKEVHPGQCGGSSSTAVQSHKCNKQRNARSTSKESITFNKELNQYKCKASKHSVTKVNNFLQPNGQNFSSVVNNFVNNNVNTRYQNALWASLPNAQIPQSAAVAYPPLFCRSFSESNVQNQDINAVFYNKNGPTSSQCNRNLVRRSSNAADSLKRIKTVERDKQLAWSLRTWQRTSLGKKLEKKKINSSSSIFTIMSYNVLAQELLTEHSFLYRKHHPRALLWDQRWSNLILEIKQHSADILCLQEVQASHIDNYYNELKKLGYDAVFKQRTGVRTDGCAIYYKTSMFNLIEHITIEFNQSDVAVLNRDNIAIIAKFSPKSNHENEFVVATTHLLYNPKREDVRLAQTQVLLSEVDRIAFKNKNHTSGSHVHLPIIITGDFNLTPDSSVYKLITRGILQYEHLSNRSLSRTNATVGNATGKYLLPPSLGITDQCQHVDLVEKRKENVMLNRDEELQHVYLQHTERYVNTKSSKTVNRGLFSTGTLSHDLALKSSYQHRHGDDIEATTFQDRWITVDYIFYSGTKDEHDLVREDKLKLISRYLIPTQRQLKGVTIPNFAFGSDHFSLVVKFKLES